QIKEKEAKLPAIGTSALGLIGTQYGAVAAATAFVSEKVKLTNPIDVEMAELTRNVTLGNWEAVKAYLAKLTDEENKAGYRQILQSLNAMRMEAGMPPQMAQFGEKNRFSADDVMALAVIAPHRQGKETINLLSGILRQALTSGTVNEHFVARLRASLEDKDKK